MIRRWGSMRTSRTIQVSIIRSQTWWKMNHRIMDPSGHDVKLPCHCSMVAGHELKLCFFLGVFVFISHCQLFHLKSSWLEDVRDSGVNFYVLLQLLQALFVNLEREAEQELVQAGHSGIFTSLGIALGVNDVYVFGCASWSFPYRFDFESFYDDGTPRSTERCTGIVGFDKSIWLKYDRPNGGLRFEWRLLRWFKRWSYFWLKFNS